MSTVAVQTDLFTRIQSLGRVAAYWLDPASLQRRDAVLALQVSTGLTARQVESALHAAFSELTSEKLHAYCLTDPGLQNARSAAETTLHILPGNVFTAWLPGAVISLLMDASCALKPS